MRPAFSRVLMVAAGLLLGVGSVWGFSVQRFSPEGQVSQQTRVTVRFSAEMVRLGEATAAAPFVILLPLVPMTVGVGVHRVLSSNW